MTDAAETPREDRIATEEPLELRLAWPGAAAQRIWVTMRTPGSDFELAAGYALAEGLVPDAGLRTVAYCTDADLTPEQEFNVVTVTLAAPPARDPGHRHGSYGAGSACGVCGKDSIADVLDVPHASPWAGSLPRLTSYAACPGCSGSSRPPSPAPVASMRQGCSPPTVPAWRFARTWAVTTPSTRSSARGSSLVSPPRRPAW